MSMLYSNESSLSSIYDRNESMPDSNMRLDTRRMDTSKFTVNKSESSDEEQD